MARKVPEINSSSQADIAFLLLCFFLMTTSMDETFGIVRRLPPPAEENVDDVQVKKRNVMNVMINKRNELLVNLEKKRLTDLKDEVIKFMTPRPNDPTAPEVEEKDIENLGKVQMSKGVISLMNDRATSYSMYISVQNELAKAFNEMRDEMAKRYFNKKYDQLDDIQSKAINDAVPVRVSEAEPHE